MTEDSAESSEKLSKLDVNFIKISCPQAPMYLWKISCYKKGKGGRLSCTNQAISRYQVACMYLLVQDQSKLSSSCLVFLFEGGNYLGAMLSFRVVIYQPLLLLLHFLILVKVSNNY